MTTTRPNWNHYNLRRRLTLARSKDPKSGMLERVELVLTERCSSDADAREYVLEEMAGVRTLARRTFRCENYLDFAPCKAARCAYDQRNNELALLGL